MPLRVRGGGDSLGGGQLRVKLFGDSAFRRGTRVSLCVYAGNAGVARQQVSGAAWRVGQFAYLNRRPSDTVNAIVRAGEGVIRLAAHAYA